MPFRFARNLVLVRRYPMMPLLGAVCAQVWMAGCDTIAPMGDEPRDTVVEGESTVSQPVAPEFMRTVPLDDREVVSAETAPPPISGGNLLRIDSGTYVAADPARDRLTLIRDGSVAGQLDLPAGSRPERMALDASGTVHIVLRGTGELAAFDPAKVQIVAQDRVCAAPRGVAFDAKGDRMIVACAEGKLVFHSASVADYRTQSVVAIDTDVRDVVPQADKIYVSRFRSAEVLTLDSSGSVLSRQKPPQVLVSNDKGTHLFEASVAWRMIEDPSADGIILLHQRAVADQLKVGSADSATAIEPGVPFPVTGGTSDGSAYGGMLGTCSAIVQTGITRIDSKGQVSVSNALDNAVLPVDIAVTLDSTEGVSTLTYSTVSAGLRDNGQPSPVTEFVGTDSPSPIDGLAIAASAPGRRQLLLLSVVGDSNAPVEVGCELAMIQGTGEPATSVVFDGKDTIFLQPESDTVMVNDTELFTGTSIALGGRSIVDTGAAIFHRDSGNGIACASCHPDGQDDGRVWNFDDVGPRRTQSLGISIAETAPYHWDGSLPTLSNLMTEVFVGRMGGVFESSERLDSLQHWLTQQPGVQLDAPDADAQQRGKELFESKDVGCAECHNGPVLTNNRAFDVGTTAEGAELQTPALVGLLLRPPYMHTGCALTIRERFVNPACGGGDKHGKTSQLNDSQIDDLVAYLSAI